VRAPQNLQQSGIEKNEAHLKAGAFDGSGWVVIVE
jgi:hypothetical protein